MEFAACVNLAVGDVWAGGDQLGEAFKTPAFKTRAVRRLEEDSFLCVEAFFTISLKEDVGDCVVSEAAVSSAWAHGCGATETVLDLATKRAVSVSSEERGDEGAVGAPSWKVPVEDERGGASNEPRTSRFPRCVRRTSWRRISGCGWCHQVSWQRLCGNTSCTCVKWRRGKRGEQQANEGRGHGMQDNFLDGNLCCERKTDINESHLCHLRDRGRALRLLAFRHRLSTSFAEIHATSKWHSSAVPPLVFREHAPRPHVDGLCCARRSGSSRTCVSVRAASCETPPKHRAVPFCIR